MSFVAKALTKVFTPSSYRPYGATGEEAYKNTKPTSLPGKADRVLSGLQSGKKTGAFARLAEQVPFRPSRRASLVPLASTIDDSVAAPFQASTSPAERGSIRDEVYINEGLAQEIDALGRQGLLPPAQRDAVGRLSEEHQAYLCSDDGRAALRQAKDSGREIDLEAFGNIPTLVLTHNPQFPSPLFELATPGMARKLGDPGYNNALTNATQCGIFDVKQTRDEGRNPIHIAALHGNVLATQTFVSLDAQTHGDPKQRALNAIDNYHQSPLEIAVNSTLPNAAQVAQILIEGDANLTPKHAKHGLLQQAVSSGDPAVVKVIVDVLRNDGIPYQKDKSGRTPLAVFRKKLRGAKESTEQQDRTQAIENILKQYKTPSN